MIIEGFNISATLQRTPFPSGDEKAAVKNTVYPLEQPKVTAREPW